MRWRISGSSRGAGMVPRQTVSAIRTEPDARAAHYEFTILALIGHFTSNQQR